MAAVRQQIAAIWGGFDSFECHAIERIDGQGEAYDSIREIDFACRLNGCSALSWTLDRAGQMTYFDVREDGKDRAMARFFPTPPRAIDEIRIGPMRSGPNRYDGLSFPALRLFLPGGRTIAAILEEGGNLVDAGTARNPRWTLTAQFGKELVECILDPEHQFLPRESTIRLGESVQVARVDRFDRVDGFWCPVEGTSTFNSATVRPPARVVLTYNLDRVAINRPIADARFTWTQWPAGVQVVNQRTRTSRIVGTKLARIRLQDEHPTPTRPPPTNDPVVVSAEANAGVRRWAVGLSLGVAILAGSVGVYVRSRGL